ncbi:hypothetical protein H9Y04_23680 [Streptomyces sp. TRM66268-LWL]|uniref:HEAT repeat domain-containing protein n=1 Tax=Streptomyces polyasparticus TaxID=2767826 RepID=A0ABR7SL23_9ACTN|nr:hypothetical protein [Streptomyces polyasparticus]MBC9715554.1 hypothetical protein [Streptomyces polyasparticus]
MGAIEELSDPELCEAARERLVAQGAAAVGPLVRALVGTDSRRLCSQIEGVLAHGLGPELAYDAVLSALAEAADDASRRQLSSAFTKFRSVERFVEALAHDSAAVRSSAAYGIQTLCSVAFGREPQPGVDYAQVAEALLPLLGDPDPEVAQRAEWALDMLGPSAHEPLRRVRARGPGRLRARALTALAASGGEEALSPADRAAVERLIRIKLPHDKAMSLDVCFTSWLAVPTDDQRGIADLLGLHEARPATFALGRDIGAHDSHDGAEYGRVYVTPAVDGWTLVLGPWCSPVAPERAADVLRLVTELSRRYGRAQAYYFGEQGGGSGWLIAENGEVVRRFSASWSSDDAQFTLGDPLPEEHAACQEEGVAMEEPEEWQELAPYLAPLLAGQLGVSPLDLGPHTKVRGAGLVALTPYARENGRPRTGAYAL